MFTSNVHVAAWSFQLSLSKNSAEFTVLSQVAAPGCTQESSCSWHNPSHPRTPVTKEAAQLWLSRDICSDEDKMWHLLMHSSCWVQMPTEIPSMLFRLRAQDTTVPPQQLGPSRNPTSDSGCCSQTCITFKLCSQEGLFWAKYFPIFLGSWGS